MSCARHRSHRGIRVRIEAPGFGGMKSGRAFWRRRLRSRMKGQRWIEVFYLLKLILRVRNQNGAGVQHTFDLHALKHGGCAFGFPDVLPVINQPTYHAGLLTGYGTLQGGVPIHCPRVLDGHTGPGNELQSGPVEPHAQADGTE